MTPLNPCILFPCTFVNVRFLHTVFAEGAGCWSSVYCRSCQALTPPYLKRVLENGVLWLVGVYHT